MKTGLARFTFTIVCLIGIALACACAATPKPPLVSAALAPRETAHSKQGPNGHADQPSVNLDQCLRSAQQRLEEFRTANGFPGATVGFVLPDDRCGSAATGVSHKSSGRPMSSDDRMLSGSIGKTYVASVLLQLVEEGRVELDTRISHWFGDEEWFPRVPNARDITLHMLMNHTSGIPRHIFMPEFQAAVKAEPQKVWRPEQLVAYVLDAEPLFPAGKGWSYADTNYILVGMIIERVTGRTYYRELSDRVLTPLKLVDTVPSDRPDIPGLVSGYTSEGNPFALPEEVASNGRYAMNPQVEWTGGGLASTSLDLARWAQFLYGGSVLKPETLRQMLEGVPMGGGSERKYGLGAMTRMSRHGSVFGHSGWMPGYVSMMAYYADQGLAVAIQVNTERGITGPLLEKVLDDLAKDLLRP